MEDNIYNRVKGYAHKHEHAESIKDYGYESELEAKVGLLLGEDPEKKVYKADKKSDHKEDGERGGLKDLGSLKTVSVYLGRILAAYEHAKIGNVVRNGCGDEEVVKASGCEKNDIDDCEGENDNKICSRGGNLICIHSALCDLLIAAVICVRHSKLLFLCIFTTLYIIHIDLSR